MGRTRFNYAKNVFILMFDHAKKDQTENDILTRLVYCLNSRLTTLSHSL